MLREVENKFKGWVVEMCSYIAVTKIQKL